MCGRYTLTANSTALQAAFPGVAIPENMTARYNIAPTQPVAVIANDGQQRLDFFQWGLIPPWAKEPTIGQKMINARAETLAEKRSFKAAYRRRRCFVIADGFYEWTGKRPKTPMYIRLKSGQPFALAGLWETWTAPTGEVIPTCTIITTTPNELVAPLHHRMAVILPPAAYPQWLDPAEQSPATLDGWLKPYPASEMEAYQVSTLVNHPKQDSPDCITPVARLF